MKVLRPLLASLAVLALVTQVLALCADYYQPNLNSDDLYLYLFCQDVLGRGGPLAGWTLGSAPYFFPDVTAYALLLGSTGLQGFALPLYAVGSALALALLAGWVLQSLQPDAAGPWWRGLLVVNLLLALRGLPGMDRWLWQELAPGFHGGAVLVGLAVTALVVRQLVGTGRCWEWGLLAVLLWLGVVSDALVLVQFGLPLLGVLWWLGRRESGVRPVCRRYLTVLIVALGLFGATRFALIWGEVFYFSKVFRYLPTPTRVAGTGWRLLTDFATDLWPITVVGGAALLLLVVWSRRLSREDGRRRTVRFVTGWVFVSIGLSVATVIGMGYWTDVLRSRYLLNVLVLPLTGVAALLSPALTQRTACWRKAWLGGATLALVALTLVAWPRVVPEKLTFPYPTDVAELDTFLSQHHLQRGLADYWTVNRCNVLGRAGARLVALRSAANSVAALSTAYFWANNAYAYFDRDPRTGAWSLPRYTFIVANRLDQASLVARYGEPRERHTVGSWQVWILADPDKVSALVAGDAHARLDGRRWQALGPELDKAFHAVPLSR